MAKMAKAPAMTRAQVRAVDRFAIETLGLPGGVLMENAGAGVVQTLLHRGARRVLIVCGKGNNGGDGYVIARRLSNVGIPVLVASTTEDPLTGDAAIHQNVWRQSVAHDSDLASHEAIVSWANQGSETLSRTIHEFTPDWIVDAMLGTGARGAARSPVAEILPVLNQANARRLAVDLPSGMDCDSGMVAGKGLRADVTCTFVAEKHGFQHASPGWLGEIVVIDIGVPASAIECGLAQHDEI